MKKYAVVVIGGTFDHFHKGHKDFLHSVISLSDHILLGLTTDKYIQGKEYNESLESYQTRYDAVMRFFREEHTKVVVEILPIDSVYIPSEWNTKPIEAIVLTDDTYTGGEIINLEREKQGLEILPIESFPLTLDSDGLSITATRIRKGEINREGRAYLEKDFLQSVLYLPDSLRKKLHIPFGTVSEFTDIDLHTIPDTQIITVGDVTTQTFLKNKITPFVSIIDFIVEREKRFSSVEEIGFIGNEQLYPVVNPAGQLTPELFRAIQSVFGKIHLKHIISITGEDDLAVLPILLTAPLHSHIFYGQPHEGMVHIIVTENIKEDSYQMIKSFTT